VKPGQVHVRRVRAQEPLAGPLADVLIDCVEGGASVSFLSPLSRTRALAFWDGVLAGVASGERIVLVAEDCAAGRIIGTVQLILAMPQNQPHRAEVAKMLVCRDARRRGVGLALMQAVEREALVEARTLLVLDTVSGSAAARLYSKLGWQRCGEIPGYALWPDGRLCDTTYYYKTLQGSA